MLSENQLQEIRNHLDKAGNPIFYYDNDADGFAAFLILRRFLDRGYGVTARSYPGLDIGYAKKAQELGADYVFVLDRPNLGREFVEEISSKGIPIVVIDHHEIQEEERTYLEEKEGVFLYNPTLLKEDKSEEPTTYLCYKAVGREEDSWIGLIGCLTDRYVPDFLENFKKRWPDYWKEGIKEGVQAYYETEIGKIAEAVNFGLKDSVTNVVALQKFFSKINGPEEVFLETQGNKGFRKKYEEMSKRHSELVERAKDCVDGNLVFFHYGGNVSMSAQVSDKLLYLFPEKLIVVSHDKGVYSNMSIRGNRARDLFEKIVSKFPEARGGGHPEAVGSMVRTEDMDKIKAELSQEVNK